MDKDVSEDSKVDKDEIAQDSGKLRLNVSAVAGNNSG
jgi:hypothetical protein